MSIDLTGFRMDNPKQLEECKRIDRERGIIPPANYSQELANMQAEIFRALEQPKIQKDKIEVDIARIAENVGMLVEINKKMLELMQASNTNK